MAAMKRQRPKILVIAEDKSVQKDLETRLASEGCQVMQAFTWNKAVDFFLSERPEAVILDIDFGQNASQINGIELIHFIKKSRNYAAPLVVYGKAPDRINPGFYAASTTFVPKSSPLEELVAVLVGMLGGPGTDTVASAGMISS